MSNTIRAALEQLVSAYAECQGQYEEVWPQYLDGPMAAASAVLAAEPEEGPSDEELDALERSCWKLDSVVEHEPGQGFREVFPKEETFDHRAFARAILARWARPAAPPAAPEGDPSDEDFLRVAEQAANIDQDGIFDALKEGYPLELTAMDILEICRAVYRQVFPAEVRKIVKGVFT